MNAVKALLTIDAAILVGILAASRIAPRSFARFIRAAVILAGIAAPLSALESLTDAEPSRLRRWWLRLSWTPLVIRAAFTPSPAAIPAALRVMIAAGAVVPIIGPVDEVAALAAVAFLALHPNYRNRVSAAWKESYR